MTAAGTPVPDNLAAVHWLDKAAVRALARTPLERRPFYRGWGDPDVIEDYLERAAAVDPIVRIHPVERPARRSGGSIVRDLTFDSPEPMLPKAASRVRARWVTTDPEPDRLVVLQAAWNDEDYKTRGRFARSLLAEGIATVMPEHPYYGDRRVDPAPLSPVSTVSDFALMGRAAVREGRSIVSYFRDRGYRVGISGYSMGGNMAAFVTTTVRFPVASSLLAAAYSPGPAFIDGVIRNSIAWDALGGETPHVVRRLQEFLMAASVLRFDPPEHTKAATLVAGTRDGFVPNASTLAIHRHWPGSKIDWVNAGHANLLHGKRDRLIAAIVDSFDRLDTFLSVRETA